MSPPVPLPDAMRHFVEYFAELGPRWGLSGATCRVHALLYLAGGPVGEQEIEAALDLAPEDRAAALKDLAEWKMVRRTDGGRWDAGGDPWELMLAGLEQRRQRELEPAMELLTRCEDEARRDGRTPAGIARRIADMRTLVEDLAAIDLQARRLSPRRMRQMIGLGGRAARVLNRAMPGRQPRR